MNLKHLTWRTRSELVDGGYHPRCAMCHKKLEHGSADMHEVFITRGDATKDGLRHIMVSENVVLVHHGKCHEQAMTKAGQRLCAESILEWESFDAVYLWLQTLKTKYKGVQITEALSLLSEVNHEREMRGL